MELDYDYWTGTFNEVSTTLKRSIAQYIRNYKNVKIGITNNPKRRAQEHSASSVKWDKMIVKYHTTSVNYINEMEKILVDHHWSYIKNEVAGGGGPNGEGPYYLYLLLKS